MTKLRKDFPTPLYYQIYIVLRDGIMQGIYPQGAILPSENEIVNRFDVSRVTARRALSELAREGLVVRKRGKGTTVLYTRPSGNPPTHGGMGRLMEDLLAIALETKVTILSFDYIAPPPEIADILALDTSDKAQKVQHSRRLRMRHDMPFSYVEAFVPEKIGRSFKKSDIHDRPLLALIEATGAHIATAAQEITAIAAPPEIAAHLDVAHGTPLIKLTRLVYDDAHQPLEYIRVYYRPDSYQLKQTMSWVRGQAHNFWRSEEHGGGS